MKKGKTTGAKKAPPSNPVKDILLEIGDTFRKVRQDKKLSFEAVAKASGVSTLYISNLEKGKYENMGLDVIHRIAEALELKLNVEVL